MDRRLISIGGGGRQCALARAGKVIKDYRYREGQWKKGTMEEEAIAV